MRPRGRLRSRRLAALAFAVAVGLSSFVATPRAVGWSPNTCAVQGLPPLAGTPNADDLRLQGLVGRFLPGLESALGSQNGGGWFTAADHTFELGLSPGSMTLGGAQQSVDAVINESLSAEDAAFALPRLRVVAVPYSDATIRAVNTQVYARAVSLVHNPAAVEAGITVGELWDVSPNRPGEIVSVTLNSLATDADCAAVLSMVESYGDQVVLSRTASGPPVQLPDPLSGPAPGARRSQSKPSIKLVADTSLGGVALGERRSAVERQLGRPRAVQSGFYSYLTRSTLLFVVYDGSHRVAKVETSTTHSVPVTVQGHSLNAASTRSGRRCTPGAPPAATTKVRGTT